MMSSNLIDMICFLQCFNPVPGPCDYCSKMQYKCEITTQRKQKPVQPNSEEQFQWMPADLRHEIPEINLDVEGLRDVDAKIGIAEPLLGNGNLPKSLAISEGGEKPENLGETLKDLGGQSEETHSSISEIDLDQKSRDTAQIPVFVRHSPQKSQLPRRPLPTLAPQLSTSAHRRSSDIPSPVEDRLQSMTRHEPSRFTPAVGAIPSRLLGDILVRKYFSEVNELHCILSYSDFMRWYQQWFPDISLVPTKQAILFTVFAIGCKDDINGPSDSYFTHAVNAMGPVLLTGSLEAVQALTLGVRRSWDPRANCDQSLYALHDSGSVCSWTLVGAAIRIAQSIGLHHDNDFPQMKDREMRRRVWWALYDMER